MPNHAETPALSIVFDTDYSDRHQSLRSRGIAGKRWAGKAAWRRAKATA